jgi:DNA-binding NtrC family response regulator
MEGMSALFGGLMRLVQRIGNSDVAVLVQGESGTRRELVPRLIYETRAKGQFVPIDCAALPPYLVEGELFGHGPRAVDGGIPARLGLIQAAHGGTVFLDKIEELPAEIQEMLLGVLQRQMIRPAGSNRSHPCRFRLISGTTGNLAEEVWAGRFRRDLYCRLNVITLDIPPLRERKADIPGLVSYFLANGGHHHQVEPELLAAMERHTWPGNIRELENCVAQLVAQSMDEYLHAEHFPAWIQTSVENAEFRSEGKRPYH